MHKNYYNECLVLEKMNWYDIINLECDYMKKINMISRVIMTIITFLLLSIVIINEDSSWFIVPVIYSLIVFGWSFPSTIFAEKIIKTGNKIDNKLLKIAYYVFLPIVLFGICLTVYMIALYINDYIIPKPTGLGDAIGQVLLLLFIVSVISIIIILPYIQAIIINILKRSKK